MISLPEPPTAIIVASLVIAYGARRALEGAGLRLGTDVSILTHDDVMSYMRNEGEPPVFTATRSSVREAGQLAAEMLLGLISDPNERPAQTLLRAELIQGQSTGPVPPTVVRSSGTSHL